MSRQGYTDQNQNYATHEYVWDGSKWNPSTGDHNGYTAEGYSHGQSTGSFDSQQGFYDPNQPQVQVQGQGQYDQNPTQGQGHYNSQGQWIDDSMNPQGQRTTPSGYYTPQNQSIPQTQQNQYQKANPNNLSNPQSNSGMRNSWNSSHYISDADKPAAATEQKKLTETDLLQQLNPQAKAMYQSMSPEGKALALKLANQDCKGKNDCKGLNSCKSDENSCAGQSSCKGKSVGPFTDKNKAVKVASMKMAEKRAKAANGTK